MKKIFLTTSMLILLGLFVFNTGNAQAWYMELTNVDGTLTQGEYYGLDIYIQGDETDNLETYFAAVRWGEDLATFAGMEYYDYTRPELFGEYTLWNGEELPDSPPGTYSGLDFVPANEVWNINGAENLDKPDEFYPIASGENHLATLWIQATTSGYFEDIASFIFGPADELVMINGEVVSEPHFDGPLGIWKEGSSSIMAPVPIPGAIFLLVPAFLGMIGLRRKKA